MKKCYIITAYIEGNLNKLLPFDNANFIICADGGYEIALSHNIIPNIVIGDCDSGAMSRALKSDANITEFIHFAQEKDVSDTFLCVEHAIKLGFEIIEIIGGIGGRVDHTISNIQTMAKFSSASKKITMRDESNFISVVTDSSITIKKEETFSISLFSFSDVCNGIKTTGLYYPLENATLRNSYPLGLSNEFSGDEATIEVKQGQLLVIMSRI
jgi:thiamine pyrophosphokinase